MAKIIRESALSKIKVYHMNTGRVVEGTAKAKTRLVGGPCNGKMIEDPKRKVLAIEDACDSNGGSIYIRKDKSEYRFSKEQTRLYGLQVLVILPPLNLRGSVAKW